jgi:signal transduction histidine kinase
MFIGILGHDLRNPLNAILLSAGSMLRQRDLANLIAPS